MKHLSLPLVLWLMTPAVTLAQPAHPFADTLHKQGMTLLKQKTIAAAGRLVTDLGKTIKEKLSQGRDYSLILGPGLTRTGKGVYLAAWADKVFSFDLSAEQTQATGVRPRSIIFLEGIPEREVGRTPDVVQLKEVSFEGGKRLRPTNDLVGWLNFTPKGKFEGEVIVRVSCLAGGKRITQFQHIRGGLPVDDRITFKLKPLQTVSGQPVPTPAIMFVDLCSTTEASGGTDLTVRSNTMAVLVDIEQPR